MLYLYFILLLLCSFDIFSMENQHKQLEVCPQRRAYIQGAQQRAQNALATCVFCDPEILAQNYILRECSEHDVRLMMNKTPTLPFDRGKHLLIMPMSHEKDPHKIAIKQIKAECDEILGVAHRLHSDAFSQEYFTNIGRIAGQSVLDHFHRQFKSFEREPLSLPEMVEASQNATITTIEQAFELMKEKMNVPMGAPETITMWQRDCLCCDVNYAFGTADDKNLVVTRLKHNYVCVTHHPVLPGELAVVPYQHASAIKDLNAEAFYENMIVATALIPYLIKYANENIRECTGANVYTKGMGGKASRNKKQQYHLYTLVMPRTVIPATPGTLEGNSCKLDLNVPEFYVYAKGIMEEVTQRLYDKG